MRVAKWAPPLVVSVSLSSLLRVSADAQELATVTVEPQIIPLERLFDGHVEAVRQATVSAETKGRIEEVYFDIGDQVSAGTVILTMTSTEQREGLNQAEAALAEAEANLVAVTAEHERIKDLYSRQFASKADFDRVTAQLNAAKARVASATAALKTAREQLSYTEIKAPYSGIVSARHIEPGEAVQPGTLLMSGYDPNAYRVHVDLPQHLAAKVREIGKARVLTESGAGIIPAKLILFPTADETTSTIRARLELPAQADSLYPGQFVKVAFEVGNVERLFVPLTAVVHRSEVTAVYVVVNDKPQLRQIRTGEALGDQVDVLAGLTAGERVALDPIAAGNIRAGTSQNHEQDTGD